MNITKVSIKNLKSHCIRSKESYFTEYKEHVIDSNGERYIYLDYGYKWLIVCHTDTVYPKSRDFTSYKALGESYIFSPALDDRLGVYTALEILPELGIQADILLTENEESAISSAYYFKPSHEYNLMVELDRQELAPVLYDYDTKEIKQALASIGLTPAIGSYSDIRELTELGICGVNFGIGYKNQHTALCSVKLSDYVKCLERLKRFYLRYHETSFKCAPAMSGYYGFRDSSDFTSYHGENGELWLKTKSGAWLKDDSKRSKHTKRSKRASKQEPCLYCGDSLIDTEYYEEFSAWLCLPCSNYWSDYGIPSGADLIAG